MLDCLGGERLFENIEQIDQVIKLSVVCNFLELTVCT